MIFLNIKYDELNSSQQSITYIQRFFSLMRNNILTIPTRFSYTCILKNINPKLNRTRADDNIVHEDFLLEYRIAILTKVDLIKEIIIKILIKVI